MIPQATGVLAAPGCHSVGYNTTATNGGFDEFVVRTLSTLQNGLLRFRTAKQVPGQDGSDYPSAAKLANIQCENCHGPQNVGSTLHNSDINNGEDQSFRPMSAVNAMVRLRITADSRNGSRARPVMRASSWPRMRVRITNAQAAIPHRAT